MALPEAVGERAKALDEQISGALRSKDNGDAQLAEGLFRLWKEGLYRAWGFRSVSEYMKDRFNGTDLDHLARMHARGHQRLIREWRLAEEIPLFKAAFNTIQRANRRLIAQVITSETAEAWIELAKSLTNRELEERIVKRVEADPLSVPGRLITKTLRLYPEQVLLWDQALGVAGELVAEMGQDPNGAVSGKVELILQEFLGTHSGHGFHAFITAECPACYQFAALRRDVEMDRADGERKINAYRCAKCGVTLVMTSVLVSS